MTKPISGAEAADLLRKIIAGTVELRLANPQQTWKNIETGDVGFAAAGYSIVIFNDGGELDYVDHILAPDGRRGDFDHWNEQHEEPIDLLSAEEQAALAAQLAQAR